jgi:ribosomal-protein-alanine N-acetyltransferase
VAKDNKVRFEPLQESHIPAILDIERVTNSAPWSERSFRNELTNAQSVFLVGFQGSEIVAYGGMWLCVDEAHITTVAVAPDHRRNGIGRGLMLELLRIAHERHMACSTLEVRAGNEPAISLYQSLGYVETARRKSYYPDNKEDAVVMWKYEL